MREKDRIEEYVEAHRDNMLEDICRLIRIPSGKGEGLPGMPYGEGPALALEAALDMAREKGFAVKNYNNHVGAVDLTGLPAGLDILAHLDVVPAGDGWSVTGAFEPLVVGDKLYGRGSADDKGPAVAALYAMLAVRDLGIPLKRNVRLLLGTDEECGGSDIEHYYSLEQEAPMTFSPDASFPVINIEKGRLTDWFRASWPESGALPRIVEAGGGVKENVVPNSAYALLEGMDRRMLEDCCRRAGERTGAGFFLEEGERGTLRVRVQGEGAHASTPEAGNNAVTALVSFLADLPLAPCAGNDCLRGVARIFPHGDWDGAAAGVAMEDGESGKLTISFNMFRYTLTGLEGAFDSRVPICGNDGNMRRVLAAALEKEGMKADGAAMKPAHHVPGDTPFVRTLLRCYEAYSGRPGKCLAIGGGTYVHDLKNGVAFGCSEPETDNRMHGPDEFAYIEDLVRSAKIFAQAIVELCC